MYLKGAAHPVVGWREHADKRGHLLHAMRPLRLLLVSRGVAIAVGCRVEALNADIIVHIFPLSLPLQDSGMLMSSHTYAQYRQDINRSRCNELTAL